jgi:nucleoside-diphosphate-sugar epimerase
MRRKVLDVSRLKALGWEPAFDFDRGIAATYDGYLRKTTSAGGSSTGDT